MRNKILIAALVVAVIASVAYAALSQLLTITGTGTTNGSWDVAITGITQTSASGATDATAPTYTDTSATFDVNLAYPGATATYEIAVANTGTIDAVLDTITGVTEANAAAPAYITYSLSGVTEGVTTLPATTGTNTATVTVTWDAGSGPVNPGETKTATISLNYIQDTP
ncbi:hypothetical protein B7Y94_02200 [Candidatus Saccharibacteria bacterium 32-49-12]|nr:MAG: hypothetical protein B7Y94_02200 [Candidatus Saccharibacteria bacterium 32-49-12]